MSQKNNGEFLAKKTEKFRESELIFKAQIMEQLKKCPTATQSDFKCNFYFMSLIVLFANFSYKMIQNIIDELLGNIIIFDKNFIDKFKYGDYPSSFFMDSSFIFNDTKLELKHFDKF